MSIPETRSLFPRQSPSLISLMVSVDVKHHVYLRQSSKAVQLLYLLGCAEEPTFLQFYAGMLKDVDSFIVHIFMYWQ